MKNTTKKLSLDAFKAKSEHSKESLEFISGGILGACHDDPDGDVVDADKAMPICSGVYTNQN